LQFPAHSSGRSLIKISLPELRRPPEKRSAAAKGISRKKIWHKFPLFRRLLSPDCSQRSQSIRLKPSLPALPRETGQANQQRQTSETGSEQLAAKQDEQRQAKLSNAQPAFRALESADNKRITISRESQPLNIS